MTRCVPSPDVVCAPAPDPHAFAQVHVWVAPLFVLALVALMVLPMVIYTARCPR